MAECMERFLKLRKRLFTEIDEAMFCDKRSTGRRIVKLLTNKL